MGFSNLTNDRWWKLAFLTTECCARSRFRKTEFTTVSSQEIRFRVNPTKAGTEWNKTVGVISGMKLISAARRYIVTVVVGGVCGGGGEALSIQD